MAHFDQGDGPREPQEATDRRVGISARSIRARHASVQHRDGTLQRLRDKHEASRSNPVRALLVFCTCRNVMPIASPSLDCDICGANRQGPGYPLTLELLDKARRKLVR